MLSRKINLLTKYNIVNHIHTKIKNHKIGDLKKNGGNDIIIFTRIYLS